MLCPNCGVELENDMTTCPLCRAQVNTVEQNRQQKETGTANLGKTYMGAREVTLPEKKFTWEILSIVLLSVAIAAFIVDFIINGRINWSEYPVAVCFTIFAYVSLFAFWNQKTIIEFIGGFCISSVVYICLDALSAGLSWSLKIGIPLLFSANVIVTVYIAVLRRSRHKGINLVAYAFAALALLCILIEIILSLSETGAVSLNWSIIVTACILPVIIILLFLHFRLKKGRSLKKTFHV